jgi:hypothetical protein
VLESVVRWHAQAGDRGMPPHRLTRAG